MSLDGLFDSMLNILWVHIIAMILFKGTPCTCVFDPEMILFGRKAPGLTIPSEVILLWYLSCLTAYGLTDRPGDGPRLIWGLHREICWKNQRNIDIWSYFLYKLLSGNFRQIVTDQIILRRMDKNTSLIKVWSHLHV